MLTIPRKTGESVVINDDIILTVIEIRGDKVRFRIECPNEATVHCEDLLADPGIIRNRLTPLPRSD